MTNEEKTAHNREIDSLIRQAESELEFLKDEIAAKQAELKEAEQQLSYISKQGKIEKISDIATMAENAGVTVDELLASFADGTIVDLLDNRKDT